MRNTLKTTPSKPAQTLQPSAGAGGQATPAADGPAQQLRAFNRYYTRRIGVLGGVFDTGPATASKGAALGPRWSLTESRVLWEVAQRPGLMAGTLAHELGLDAGYISRLLSRLQQLGLLRVQRSALDARRKLLTLTAAGRRAHAALDQQAHAQTQALLAPLAATQQQELLYAARRMQQLLTPGKPDEPATLRSLQPGDLGWVVSRHGALYAADYGWDQRFEALVARIAADFVDQLNPAREAAWVAECDGHAMGCVFLVQARDEQGKPLPGVAQLRMLLVEPAARGRGLGKRLVQQCHLFAAQAGYRTVRLWTNSLLLVARAIYQAAGYRLLSSEAHHSFGQSLVGEVWEVDLPAQPAAADSPPSHRPSTHRRP